MEANSRVEQNKAGCQEAQAERSGASFVPPPSCQYCGTSRRPIDWHHPRHGVDRGVLLCQPCHSILQGRRRRYPREWADNRSLADIRRDLEVCVSAYTGIAIADFNKA